MARHAATTFGYALSSEEFGPSQLIAWAKQAEAAGFEFALISDHFHPWIDRQGQSPFVWAVLGGIAQATERLRIGTGVTCPLIRIHPAIVAQAAATVAVMFAGRFFLGIGGGENLNEHIVGRGWPEPDVRIEMLSEAVQIIRLLWQGEECSYRGRYYTVEQARLYTLPADPPPLCIAADGEQSASCAGQFGDGFIGVAPERELIDQYRKAGGKGPRYGQITVCWADSVAAARKTARAYWPNSALKGHLSWEIKTPKMFEYAVAGASEDDVAESVICGPDPDAYLEKIDLFQQAGYDHIYFHQVGPDQDGFFRFFETTLSAAVHRGTRPRSHSPQRRLHATKRGEQRRGKHRAARR